MFESLTDEGYIPCVSLLDFQKTGGKLDMTAYGRALDFGYKTYVLTTLYTSKTILGNCTSPAIRKDPIYQCNYTIIWGIVQ